MGRRKQSRPTRPDNRRVAEEVGAEEDVGQSYHVAKRPRKLSSLETESPTWRSLLLPETRGDDGGKEVAEVSLLDALSATCSTRLAQGGEGNTLTHVRIRLQLPWEGRARLGSLPEVSRQDLRVQVLMYPEAAAGGDACDGSSADHSTGSEMSEDSRLFDEVLAAGEIDGPDAAISALAYLISLEFVNLRPAPCLACPSSCPGNHGRSGRLRVLITAKAFASYEGATRRPLWRRALQTIMFWLRPELVSEFRSSGLGIISRYDEEITETMEKFAGRNSPGKQLVFDPSMLYEAVKRSPGEPSLDMSFPELLPDLRPYQRRAAYWMVQRERGFGAGSGSQFGQSRSDACISNDQLCPSSSVPSLAPSLDLDEHPLWVSVLPLDGSSEFFFNPYEGAVSLAPHDFVSYVKGGILADEMGLGKTLELLACILANPCKDVSTLNAAEAARKLLQTKIAACKRERVDCSCGTVEDDEEYEETWVQCDVCDAWQHAACVGYARPIEFTTLMNKRISPKGQKTNTNTRNRKSGRNSVKGIAQEADEHLSVSRKRKREGSNKKKSRIGSHGSKDLSDEDSYVCGACAMLIGSVQVQGDCRATLVVCPAPILQQWQDEILRHTRSGSLKVMVYEGVEKGAFLVVDGRKVAAQDSKRLKIVSAHDLAGTDIVLTTYDTLRTDLSHDSDKSESNHRSLRYIKRYPVVPTPLTRLRWWRVCLDEAQMVESSTARATEMALLLDAQNRWCVTGTPVQRGLDDLFGLLRFLRAEPFSDYQNWNQALQQPYKAGDAKVMSYMHKFLGALMWRSSKAQVKNELDLPPQEECLSWLRLSAVEAHFYRQQHEKCAVKAREVVAKYGRQCRHPGGTLDRRESPNPPVDNAGPHETIAGQPTSMLDVGLERGVTTDLNGLDQERNGNTSEQVALRSARPESLTSDLSTSTDDCRQLSTFSNSDADRPLSNSEVSLLSTSLLRLRQACCHPQVGSAGIRSLQQRSPMTMDEILQVLVNKAKIEAEEALRALIGALNGLAALAIIDSDISLAVSIYREALALTEENAAQVDVDPLQKLHTLHNLAEVLGICSVLQDTQESNSHGVEPQPGPLQTTGAVAGQFTSTSQNMTGIDVINSMPASFSVGAAVLGRISESQGLVLQEKVGLSNNDKLTSMGERGENSRAALGQSSSGGAGQPQPNEVLILGSKVPRTLRDDLLMKQCQGIKSKYMASFHAKLASGRVDFESASLQVSAVKKDCEACGGTQWWLDVLAIRERRGDQGEELVNKIRHHLLETDNLGKRGRHRNASSLALRFKEISGLKYVVQRELDALGSAHDQVVDRLKKLSEAMKNPTVEDAEKIANCPRDSERTSGSLCAHCEMDDLFQAYENRLFLLRTSAAEAYGVVSAEDAVIAQHRILAHKRISGSKDPQVTGRNQSVDVNNVPSRTRRGTTGTGATEAEVLRAPSEIEQILSLIKAHARQATGDCIAATKHLHMFEAMKKEYAHMRALTKIQREVLYALDELNMATTRLTLRVPGEVTENEVELLVKLPAEEVPQRNVQLTSDKYDALREFSRAKGQLRYLQGLSLARRQEHSRSRLVSGSGNACLGSLQETATRIESWHNVEEEACPVCHDKLGSQLMVQPCGHLLCCKCCMNIIERTSAPPGGLSQKRINCPTCRRRTYVGDIALVDNDFDKTDIAAQMSQLPGGAKSDEEAFMQVEGSYGTKIEAVVRRLLWVKAKDPVAKVLIFSTWHDVLDVLEHALSANRITFARVKSSKQNEPIQRFKGSRDKRGQALASDEHVQVLLLPTEKGGNGLNLVEAQHVILVEPLPNPALEAQAINRVHRIGQNRATFVHRFIVSDTVEESVYWLGRKKAKLVEGFPSNGMGFRKKNRDSLTLNDVSALFAFETLDGGTTNGASLPQSTAMRSLTPAAAAAAAAEARLRSNAGSHHTTV